MAATFKSEKQFAEWLAANPAAARRVAGALISSPPAPRGAVVNAPAAAATPQGAVVVRMPRRAGTVDHYAPLPPSAFDRALAWFFVVLTGVGALGAWGCLCAVLALEYVR